jgi:hypothetical protein
LEGRGTGASACDTEDLEWSGKIQHFNIVEQENIDRADHGPLPLERCEKNSRLP